MEFDYIEKWDDGIQKYVEFDVITRRYLQYCLMTGQNIEDYIQGLNQDELDEHFLML